jgi:hypothetical protein
MGLYSIVIFTVGYIGYLNLPLLSENQIVALLYRYFYVFFYFGFEGISTFSNHLAM